MTEACNTKHTPIRYLKCSECILNGALRFSRVKVAPNLARRPIHARAITYCRYDTCRYDKANGQG